MKTWKFFSLLPFLTLALIASLMGGCLLPQMIIAPQRALATNSKQIQNNLAHTVVVNDGCGWEATLAPGASVAYRGIGAYTSSGYGGYDGYGYGGSYRRICLLAKVRDGSGKYLGVITHEISSGDCSPWIINYFQQQNTQ